MNMQGAQANHKTDSAYQLLSAALELGRGGQWHSYPALAARRGLSYMNFNRRAKREVEDAQGFLEYKREGRRSFIRPVVGLMGTNGDIKREFRRMKGWE